MLPRTLRFLFAFLKEMWFCFNGLRWGNLFAASFWSQTKVFQQKIWRRWENLRSFVAITWVPVDFVFEPLLFSWKHSRFVVRSICDSSSCQPIHCFFLFTALKRKTKFPLASWRFFERTSHKHKKVRGCVLHSESWTRRPCRYNVRFQKLVPFPFQRLSTKVRKKTE